MRTPFLLLALAAAPAAALAQDASPNYFFGGIGLGASKFHNDCTVTPGTSCDTSDTAVRLFGGWRFDENFGAELGYSDLGSANLAGTSIAVTAWDLSLLGILPLRRDLSLLARFGVFRSTADASGGPNPGKDYDTGTTWGFGLQYDFNPTFALRGEWQRYDKVSAGANGDGNVDRFSLAAVFRFK